MNTPKPKLDIDTTRERLVALGCSHAADHLDQMLSDAVRQEIAPHAFLDFLLETELSGREARRVKTSLKLSNLPTGQTLENFDFAVQPAIGRRLQADPAQFGPLWDRPDRAHAVAQSPSAPGPAGWPAPAGQSERP
jgi:hypothetical protein